VAVQIERHGDRRVTESLADDLGGYALPHEFDGEDLRPTPLLERKAALRRLLRRAKAGIHFVDHVEGDGAKFFAHACELGARRHRLEGPDALLSLRAPQDLAQDQKPAGAWRHSVRGSRCASEDLTLYALRGVEVCATANFAVNLIW